MTIQVRRLTSPGLDVFEQWLLQKDGEPPLAILEDPHYTEPIGFETFIDPGLKFETTFAIGEYLNSALPAEKDSDASKIFGDTAMWSWLSLALIANLLSKTNKGGGKIGQPLAVNHYVQTTSSGSRQNYRLIVRAAWWAVRLHGDGARIALGSKESPWGELADQILGRPQLASHPVFFAVARQLYLDAEGNMKRGAAGKRDKSARKNPKARAGLGAVRRLALTINQFGKTFNTRAISTEKMVDLLPKEYERFEKQPPQPTA